MRPPKEPQALINHPTNIRILWFFHSERPGKPSDPDALRTAERVVV